MKSLSKLMIFVFLVLYLGSYEADSQSLFTKFKAKAGFLKAESYAKTTTGMKEPKLRVIGTLNQTIPFGEIEVTIEIDPTNGTSSGWLYVMVDKADTTKSGAYFVLKPIIGDYLVIEIPGIDFGGMGFEISENMFVSDYDWMDSDKMTSKLMTDAGFVEFYNNNKPFDNVAVGLFVGPNPGNPEGEINPLWAVSLSNQDYQKFCTVQAVTGEVTCSPVFTDVKDLISITTDLFPNPASDYVNINLNKINGSVECSISDLFGRVVSTNHLVEGENRINVSSLMPGMYIARIGNKFSKFIKK